MILGGRSMHACISSAYSNEHVEDADHFSIDALLEYTKKGEPVILEGAEVIDPERWRDHDRLSSLLKDVPCLVKRSPCQRFRYFDVNKNTGKRLWRKS